MRRRGLRRRQGSGLNGAPGGVPFSFVDPPGFAVGAALAALGKRRF